MNSGTTRINDQRSSKENSPFLQSKRMEDETQCGWIQMKVFFSTHFFTGKNAQLDKPANSSGANAAHPQVMQRGLQPLAKKNVVKLGGTRMGILEGNINKDHNSKPMRLV